MSTPRPGRPRSDRARGAVLRAVDDLLVEVGYAQVTMKAIAERAGVSRQTVYRWWSNPAEVLLEASSIDAETELRVDDASAELMAVDYLNRLHGFLSRSDAGLAYRALLGAAQQDPRVAELLGRTADPLRDSALAVARATCGPSAPVERLRMAAAALVGPVLFEVMTAGALSPEPLGQLAESWTSTWSPAESEASTVGGDRPPPTARQPHPAGGDGGSR